MSTHCAHNAFHYTTTTLCKTALPRSHAHDFVHASSWSRDKASRTSYRIFSKTREVGKVARGVTCRDKQTDGKERGQKKTQLGHFWTPVCRRYFATVRHDANKNRSIIVEVCYAVVPSIFIPTTLSRFISPRVVLGKDMRVSKLISPVAVFEFQIYNNTKRTCARCSAMCFPALRIIIASRNILFIIYEREKACFVWDETFPVNNSLFQSKLVKNFPLNYEGSEGNISPIISEYSLVFALLLDLMLH